MYDGGRSHDRGGRRRRHSSGFAAIGSDVTSCEFAVNVRDAYVDAGGRGNRSIRAFSPKTGRTYTMTCRGEPVTCTGGNNAVVHLY